MSYLSKCEKTGTGERGRWTNWRLRWRSVSGTVILYDGVVIYKRWSKLGELLRKNHEFERKYIADEIEKQTGERPVAFTAQ